MEILDLDAIPFGHTFEFAGSRWVRTRSGAFVIHGDPVSDVVEDVGRLLSELARPVR